MPARIPMTQRQRAALLALPDSEAAVVRHYGLDAEDLAAIGTARTPATRLSYALQLCCLLKAFRRCGGLRSERRVCERGERPVPPRARVEQCERGFNGPALR